MGPAKISRSPATGWLAITCLGVLGSPVLMHFGAAEATTALPLHADRHRYADRLLLDGPEQRYILQGMKPSTGYEVRVSYPATLPALLDIEVFMTAVDDSTRTLTRPHRRLLNADKVMFVSPAEHTNQEVETLLQVLARRDGVHRTGSRGGSPYVVYNIVLQELWLGLPMDAMPAGIVLLLLLALLVWAVLRDKDLTEETSEDTASPGSKPLEKTS